MNPNKSKTAVHGCKCPGEMAVRMREVLARPWVGVCVPLAWSLSWHAPFLLPIMQLQLSEKISASCYSPLIWTFINYMAETISKPDKAIPSFVATQAGKKGPSCPLGMSCVGPARKSSLFGSLYWPRSFVGCLLTETSCIRRYASQKWTPKVGSWRFPAVFFDRL